MSGSHSESFLVPSGVKTSAETKILGSYTPTEALVTRILLLKEKKSNCVF